MLVKYLAAASSSRTPPNGTVREPGDPTRIQCPILPVLAPGTADPMTVANDGAQLNLRKWWPLFSMTPSRFNALPSGHIIEKSNHNGDLLI